MRDRSMAAREHSPLRERCPNCRHTAIGALLRCRFCNRRFCLVCTRLHEAAVHNSHKGLKPISQKAAFARLAERRRGPERNPEQPGVWVGDKTRDDATRRASRAGEGDAAVSCRQRSVR